MISDQVVVHQHWLTAQEFTDIITISQMTPGPWPSILLPLWGCVLLVLPVPVCHHWLYLYGGVDCLWYLSYLSKVFHIEDIYGSIKRFKSRFLGLIMAAAAIILSLAFFKEGVISTSNLQIPAVIIFTIILFIARKWKINPIALMVLSGVMGVFIYR